MIKENPLELNRQYTFLNYLEQSKNNNFLGILILPSFIFHCPFPFFGFQYLALLSLWFPYNHNYTLPIVLSSYFIIIPLITLLFKYIQYNKFKKKWFKFI